MTNFIRNKAIFWDFDGVILDSMPIRDIGFKEILKNYPPQKVDELLKFHQKNGGLSRYVKLRYFYEEILEEPVSNSEIQRLADQFSLAIFPLLSDPSLLIRDSLDFIVANHSRQPMNIVSGSDQNELKRLCYVLNIWPYFKAICGSPTPKNLLVKNLLREQNLDKKEAVLIGDSINDYEAAVFNEIDFLGYNNIALKGIGHGYIENFKRE